MIRFITDIFSFILYTIFYRMIRTNKNKEKNSSFIYKWLTFQHTLLQKYKDFNFKANNLRNSNFQHDTFQFLPVFIFECIF